MARKRDTGAGTPYDGQEEAALGRALMRAYDRWAKAGEPSRIDVRARVEWAGTYMGANGGMRRTRVDVNAAKMAKVREAIAKLKQAQGKAAEAKPSTRYKAKGWKAQLRELLEAGDRGSKSADRAGLNPTERTVKAWLSEEREPSKANQQRINDAYGEMRNWRVSEARTSEEAARHEAAEAMTEAMKDRYGANVRFRDIEDLGFE